MGSTAQHDRVARSFLALASGDALARVIAFGAQVWIAQRLGPAMLGVVGFANAVLLYFKNAGQCGVDLLGVREAALDPRGLARTVPAVLGCRTLVCLLLALVLAGGALAWLPSPDAEVLALYALTLVSVGPDARWVHTGAEDTRPVAVARIAGELVFVLAVLLVVREPSHIARVPLAQAVGDALTALVLFLWLGRLGVPRALRLDWARAGPILRRGLPLVGNVLLGLTIFNADLICLRVFRDLETVGLYQAAYVLIGFLINLAMAYSVSLLPSLTRADHSGRSGGGFEERDSLYAESHARCFAVGLALAVGGAFTAHRITSIVFGPEFEASGAPLAVLILTLPFLLSKEVDLIALVVRGREGLVLRMTVWAVCANAGLNLALIPRFGMLGAAAATLATEVLRALLARWHAGRAGLPATARIARGRRWRSAVSAAAMAGALAAFPAFAPPPGAAGLAAQIALGALAYLGVLLALGGIRFQSGRPRLEV